MGSVGVKTKRSMRHAPHQVPRGGSSCAFSRGKSESRTDSMTFLPRNTRTGSNKSVGVKTKRSMRHSSPRRLGTTLVMLLAMTQPAMSLKKASAFQIELEDAKTIQALKSIKLNLVDVRKTVAREI